MLHCVLIKFLKIQDGSEFNNMFVITYYFLKQSNVSDLRSQYNSTDYIENPICS